MLPIVDETDIEPKDQTVSTKITKTQLKELNRLWRKKNMPTRSAYIHKVLADHIESEIREEKKRAFQAEGQR
jgi:metal-responsive CopG/Arc/MetJ family transcriptional regulator